ncbi:hypothetical protein Poli38472_006124 [Pythium oligandrum]|uniref:RING-type domain-containing protein n=1 Tax=Pythium oligandrum TaxID=41045 RepID=A0A8K1FMU7_PYTOL|nr:hypothetical protein Poli38472_006124 [Pythium oligandrum]|eukprot:TMW68656.1 hypothetical protein Poli38472_006124 [Pythium oligandrum]
MHRTRGSVARASMPSPEPAGKSQECHICLEELRQDLTACPCGHVYHEDCILQALEVNPHCPSCRGRATPRQLIRLYFDVPSNGDNSGDGSFVGSLHSGGADDAQVAALNERVSILVERLQWQKKQHDMLLAEMKRLRHQSEQLMVDKQTLMQRVATLDVSRKDLQSKVAKYQIELSRQAAAARQMEVNQSIINYLNTCDGDALEDEIQNPRELITALKKACKFRHDQYQKVIKEKTRLKSMVQSLQNRYEGAPSSSASHEMNDRVGKSKMKSPMENKRSYPNEYTTPHPLEPKKRRVTISPAGAVSLPGASLSAAAASSLAPNFAPCLETSAFRASAYTDVSIRPVHQGMPRPQSGFTRSSYNPNQYGSYNLTPSVEAPVQATNHAVCRRGYDETGKLTNFFVPKESKRSSQGGSASHPQNKSIPGMHHLLGLQRREASSSSSANAMPTMRSSAADRRDYSLTRWFGKN